MNFSKIAFVVGLVIAVLAWLFYHLIGWTGYWRSWA
jgi:hypothetical protein